VGIELEPNQGGCYEARSAGCTCAWLRGFGVDDRNQNDWTEKILVADEQCCVHRVGGGS
jgi:hypothetical protein